MNSKKSPWTWAIAVPAGLAVVFAVIAVVTTNSGRQKTTNDASTGSSNGANVPNAGSSPTADPNIISPWNATPENTPDAGEGFTPAWQVKLPPPPPVVPPPPIDPPRDPQSTSQPPPNTVEGDRPVRGLPGSPP